MVFVGGALSSGIGALSALLSPQDKPKTGVSSGAAFDIGSAGSAKQAASAFPASNLSPATFSAVLSAQSDASASSSDKSAALQRLFSDLDTDGSGGISKAEFEQQLGAGGTNVANADKVFGKIDADGDGSISLDELTKALSATKHKHAHRHGQGGNQDPLLKALDDVYQQTKSLTKTPAKSSVSVAA